MAAPSREDRAMQTIGRAPVTDRESVQRADDVGRRPRRTWSAHRLAATVLVVVIVIFAVANTQDATVDFISSNVTIPLFVVIAVVGVIGFGAGWLVRARRDKR
jgi:uncharacterized integral membrane protein